MKKIIIIAIATLTAICATGCKDFLDVKPQGTNTTDTYFQNDQQAIDAVDHLYQYLGDEYLCSQDIHWDECCTNQMCGVRAGDCSGWFNHFNLEFSGDRGTLPEYFKLTYEYIAASNWVVSALLKKQKTTELTAIESRSLGEAYFLRGFWHYLAALRYGAPETGVPFIKYEDFEGDYDYSIPPQQATVMDNYKLMIEDFEAAKALLPSVKEYDASNRGRACKESALAMESRIYTYWATFDNSKWQNVIDSVNELERMGRKLTSTYEELFTEEPSQFFSDEYCWGVASTGFGNGGGIWFEEVCIASDMLGYFDGWGEFNASADLYEAMLADGEGNDRLKRSILTVGETADFGDRTCTVMPQYGDQSTTGFFINKWTNSFKHSGAMGEYYTDVYVNMMYHFVRFADCLLYRAEAYLNKNDSNNALKDINAVRNRSGLTDWSGDAWEGLYHERFCELAFEGGSWFHEIKRWARSEYAKVSPTINKLAINELEGHPNAWIYTQNEDGVYEHTSTEPFVLYQSDSKKWADYKFAMPYPSTQVTNSNGALKQPEGYR
ncbi:MAG: RagB/SusD family nutrient uptake outer membrane protein [Bacteroidales bacterium]|nr:RagB/SusD family nutrient uptake outer membrane protein [Candidatus Cryptobacteroides choladohippi]